MSPSFLCRYYYLLSLLTKDINMQSYYMHQIDQLLNSASYTSASFSLSNQTIKSSTELYYLLLQCTYHKEQNETKKNQSILKRFQQLIESQTLNQHHHNTFVSFLHPSELSTEFIQSEKQYLDSKPNVCSILYSLFL